jgi:hypothetical protein
MVVPPPAGVLADHTHDYKWPVFVGTIASALAALAVTSSQLSAEGGEVEAAGAPTAE